MLVIGSGFGGIAAGKYLKDAGFKCTILEKEGRIGGTWAVNQYPGCACDVPSFLYSFSFLPSPPWGWTKHYGSQTEIRAYLEYVAQAFEIMPMIRLNSKVEELTFDSAAKIWHAKINGGKVIRANFVISAVGQLNRPAIPKFPGINDFKGRNFHSARWDKSFDPAGKTIAVVGTGASAIQFVPEIAPHAKLLHVFQRSPAYILPKKDYHYSKITRWIFTRIPFLAKTWRFCIWASLDLHFVPFVWKSLGRAFEKIMIKPQRVRQLKHRNREFYDKVTPRYPVGCKRTLISSVWYPAIARDNVNLIDDPVVDLYSDGVLTKSGKRFKCDTVIWGTGFKSSEFLEPMVITGRTRTTLFQCWKGTATAYLGIAVPGFPNFFMLYGPNTNLGHNSIIFMIECQLNYIVKCMEEVVRRNKGSIEVQTNAFLRFNEYADTRIRRTAFAENCDSWYKTKMGKIVNNWFGSTAEYWIRTAEPDFENFSFA